MGEEPVNSQAAAEAPQQGQHDSGLLCLALIARVLGRPVDTGQLLHRYGGHSSAIPAIDVVRAGRALDLKLRKISTKWERLASTPLPAIACLKDGSFFVLAALRNQSNQESVLIAHGHDGKPRTLSRLDFERLWSGELILVATRASLTGTQRRFDVTWFIPAIVKYRHIFGEVLLASFIIQVLALAAPLMFQVVIDKVMVHRSLSTLDVLIFALVAMALFETVFGCLRAYLFSHTTNRIDLELGAQLFGHLMALPLSYFEARRVGDSVARVRELENIRNFLTGSTITVTVDLAFTFVFIAVMFLYSPLLTWITLASVPFYVGISFIVTPILRQRLDEKFARGSEINPSLLSVSVA